MTSTPHRPSRKRRPTRTDVPRAAAPRADGARAVRHAGVPASRPAASLAAALDAAARRDIDPVEDFAALGLPAGLVAALRRRDIVRPTPIQARTLPDAFAGRDILGRAETGSGKTLAFGLPLLARLAGAGCTPGAPRALILVPTRELAEQVKEALLPLARAAGLRVTAVYGGASMGRQIDALRTGVDVLVATPGRLEDHLRRGTCRLDDIAVTVLDEADYMADLGFLPAVTRLLDATPPDGQRLLFSATLDGSLERLVRSYLRDPVPHAVASAAARIDTMDHQVFTVTDEHKVPVTAEIVARPARTLVFVRTKHRADRLATHLTRLGAPAGAIHGNLRQSQRQRALDEFAAGRVRVLVATDVAARGIHVDDVDLVVHFDPPNDGKDYLHRSGRTARAGRSGTVLSLVLPSEGRGVGRMHDGLALDVRQVAVRPGDEPVRRLATSGTPIVPTPRSERRGGASVGGERSRAGSAGRARAGGGGATRRAAHYGGKAGSAGTARARSSRA